jgi:hypothetical protein
MAFTFQTIINLFKSAFAPLIAGISLALATYVGYFKTPSTPAAPTTVTAPAAAQDTTVVIPKHQKRLQLRAIRQLVPRLYKHNNEKAFRLEGHSYCTCDSLFCWHTNV